MKRDKDGKMIKHQCLECENFTHIPTIVLQTSGKCISEELKNHIRTKPINGMNEVIYYIGFYCSNGHFVENDFYIKSFNYNKNENCKYFKKGG